MNAKRLERDLKRRLKKSGIHILPDTPAERGLAASAQLGAALANTGNRAVREVSRAAEEARDAIHNATRPRNRR